MQTTLKLSTTNLLPQNAKSLKVNAALLEMVIKEVSAIRLGVAAVVLGNEDDSDVAAQKN